MVNHDKQSRRGLCFQNSVESDDIERSLKSAMRCFPSSSNAMLYLGETREAVMAQEVLRIAANGHLVFTTLHGSDILSSIKRFVALAARQSGEMEARSMLSTVLRVVLHQRLEPLALGQRKIKARMLYLHHPTGSPASKIRAGSIDGLGSDIDAQQLRISRNQSLITTDS